MGDDRPALDLHLRDSSPELPPLLDALLDDFHPFAIEDLAPHSRRVHFFRGADRDAALDAIAHQFDPARVKAAPVEVPDERWAERSQASLRAVRVERIVVAPPWDQPTLSPPDTLVTIRPSMGFGTGHHASTRLCLGALQAQPVAGRAVLDIGTGSGVLAIAAAKLGAATVVAVDSDADAVATARDNVRLNDVERQVDIRHADFRDAAALEAASLVLANLSGALVRTHVDRLAQLVNAGGSLIVGGVLEQEEPAVRGRLEAHGSITAVRSEDEWRCVVLAMPAAGG